MKWGTFRVNVQISVNLEILMIKRRNFMKEKLVRDNIPEIIMKNGHVPHTRVLSDEEYVKQLEIKLLEETNEYLESKDVEELADILEVIYAISQFKGVALSELESVRRNKAEKNGSFHKKLLLFDITS